MRLFELILKVFVQIVFRHIVLSIKFLGINSLQAAVHLSVDTELVDYLLSRGVSPGEKDMIRGCAPLTRNHRRVLKVLLAGIFTITSARRMTPSYYSFFSISCLEI